MKLLDRLIAEREPDPDELERERLIRTREWRLPINIRLTAIEARR